MRKMELGGPRMGRKVLASTGKAEGRRMKRMRGRWWGGGEYAGFGDREVTSPPRVPGASGDLNSLTPGYHSGQC